MYFFTAQQSRVSLGAVNGKPISHQYILRLALPTQLCFYSGWNKVENWLLDIFKKAFSISCKIVRAFGADRRPITVLEKHLYSIREKVRVIRRARARHALVLCGKIRSDFLLCFPSIARNDYVITLIIVPILLIAVIRHLKIRFVSGKLHLSMLSPPIFKVIRRIRFTPINKLRSNFKNKGRQNNTSTFETFQIVFR